MIPTPAKRRNQQQQLRHKHHQGHDELDELVELGELGELDELDEQLEQRQQRQRQRGELPPGSLVSRKAGGGDRASLVSGGRRELHSARENHHQFDHRQQDGQEGDQFEVVDDDDDDDEFEEEAQFCGRATMSEQHCAAGHNNARFNGFSLTELSDRQLLVDRYRLHCASGGDESNFEPLSCGAADHADDEQEDEQEYEVFPQLDTIVEEDENSDEDAGADLRHEHARSAGAGTGGPRVATRRAARSDSSSRKQKRESHDDDEHDGDADCELRSGDCCAATDSSTRNNDDDGDGSGSGASSRGARSDSHHAKRRPQAERDGAGATTGDGAGCNSKPGAVGRAQLNKPRQEETDEEEDESRGASETMATNKPPSTLTSAAANIDGCDTGGSKLQANTRKTTALSEDTIQQEQSAATERTKMAQQQHYQRQFSQPVPSTNRLIIEHQARQQQALFRLLAERQKLMDELGAEQRGDLMSSLSSLNLAAVAASSDRSAPGARRTRGDGQFDQQRRRRRRKRRQRQDGRPNQHQSESSGVPLSVVDLSSMSDRMLDDLLGHIASASSSSLSSNGESLDSSDFSGTCSSSSSYDDDEEGREDDDDQCAADGRPAQKKSASSASSRARRSAASDNCAPSVIGVHEDERSRSNCLRQVNCRDAHRRGCDNGNERNDDDDDDNKDHELVVSVGDACSAGGGPTSSDLAADSLSPNGDGSGASNESVESQPQRSERARRERLERQDLLRHYAGELLSRHEALNECQPAADGAQAQANRRQLVEKFLVMLIQELDRRPAGGRGDQQQQASAVGPESTGELLERVLGQLEQISGSDSARGCTPPGTTGAPQPGSQQPRSHPHSHPRPHPLQQQQTVVKQQGAALISHKQQLQNGNALLLLSKDSDYGSDTQSADCLSQTGLFNDASSDRSPLASRQSSGGLPQTPAHAAGARWSSQQHQLQQQQQLLLSSNSESPSPSSLTTSSTQTIDQHSSSPASSCSAPPTQRASAAAAPSGAAAAEFLSSKLDHLLRLLAHQQQQPAQSSGAEKCASNAPAPAASAARSTRPANGRERDDDAASAAAEDLAADFEASLAAQCELRSASARQRVAELGGAGDDTIGWPASANKMAGAASKSNSTAAAVPTQKLGASPGGKRSPMKSIVLLNATRPPSAASNVSSASFGEQPQRLASAGSRNLTPVVGADEGSAAPPAPPAGAAPKRNQFKTCVSIGSSSPGNQQQQVSSVLLADSEQRRAKLAPSSAASAAPLSGGDEREGRLADDDSRSAGRASAPSDNKTGGRERPAFSQKPEEGREDEANQLKNEQDLSSKQQVATTSPAASFALGQQQQSNFVRRRSSRSSLRRRPSFSGSVGSQTREPRPDSPAPRPLVGVHAAEPEAAQMDEQGAANEHVKQRQLQRALILAQKYNYSPAKLAASKLGSRLQLGKERHSAATSSSSQSQSRLAAASTEAEAAINGSQALKGNGGLGRNSAADNWQQQYATREPTSKSNSQQQLPVQITGKVQLDISYFAKSGSLTIHVLQCAQLAPVAKRRTTSNPYVKLYLLPNKGKGAKRKSSIKKGQLNPVFDEKFTFGPIQLSEFDCRTLWLSVWHKDRLGRNEFLGEILLPLSQVRYQLLTSDLCQSTSAKWYQLQDQQLASSLADISTSLKRQQLDSSKQQQLANVGNWTPISAAATLTRLDALDSGDSTTTTTANGASNLKAPAVSAKMPAPRPPANSNGASPSASSTLHQRTANLLHHHHHHQQQVDETHQTRSLVTTSDKSIITGSSIDDGSLAASGGSGSVAPPSGDKSTYQMQHLDQTLSTHRNQAPSVAAASAQRNIVHLGPLPGSNQNNTSTSNSSSSNCQQSSASVSGQLFVAIKFVPHNPEQLSSRTKHMTGQLHVTIKEARNVGGFESPSLATLSAVMMQQQQQQQQQQEGGHQKHQQQPPTAPALAMKPLPSGALPKPFCKCYLLDLSNGQRLAKQKTTHLKRTSNPRWDHTCVFDNIRLADLGERAVEIQMFNRDSILVNLNNEYMGGVRLCCSQEDKAHQGSQQQVASAVGGDSTSIASDQSAESGSLSRQSLGGRSFGNNSAGQQEQQQAGFDDNVLSTERESRLWNQMIRRPNIWVFGELRLRPLRPVIAKLPSATTCATTNEQIQYHL